MRSASLLLAACVVAAPLEARTEESVGLLELAGPQVEARRLEQRLREAIEAGNLAGPVTGDRLRQRLRTPDSVAALDAARTRLVEAERAVVFMNRRPALRAAADAILILEKAGGRHLAPELLARAHGALALAHLLRPADAEQALREMVTALAAWRRWEPSRDSLSPRAAALLEEARARPPAPRPPADEELGRLARQARLERLLWIAISEGGLQLVVHDRATGRTTSQRWSSSRGPSLDEAVERVRVLLGGRARQPVASLEPPPPRLEATRPPASSGQADAGPAVPREPRPIYKRWWFWTLASAVVVGTVLAVTLTTLREPTTEVRFRY